MDQLLYKQKENSQLEPGRPLQDSREEHNGATTTR